MGITFDSGLRFTIIIFFQKAPDEPVSVATTEPICAIFCLKNCCLKMLWLLFYSCMVFFFNFSPLYNLYYLFSYIAEVVVCGSNPYLKLTLSSFSWLLNTFKT